jgi:CheY-like chemotaxis protein
MLAFARRQELRPETVDVARLVDSMLDMLRRALGPMIQISTDFDGGLAPVHVDPNQFELALLNLAVNARDAMPLGGELTITARREHIGTGEIGGLGSGDYICIGVRDTGCGMDDATLRRASEPFFTTKGPGRGTGLGLSMVDGLVAQSGGTMRISSRMGIGTNVELWLPVSLAPDWDVPKPDAILPHPGDTRSVRVLLVDDDAIVAAGTAAMIEDLGYSVVEAESAATALDLLRADPTIDIVITDYVMPGMTGSELAEEAHRMRPGLPVAIATGYADAAREAAALPRLNKPYRQHDLAALIAKLLDLDVTLPAPHAAADAAVALLARR